MMKGLWHNSFKVKLKWDLMKNTANITGKGAKPKEMSYLQNWECSKYSNHVNTWGLFYWSISTTDTTKSSEEYLA